MERKQCFTVVHVIQEPLIVMVTANGIINLKNVFQTVESTKIAILMRNAAMKNVFQFIQTVEHIRIANLILKNAKMKNVLNVSHIQHIPIGAY